MNLTNIYLQHYKKIFFLFIIGLIVYRSPDLFLYPRFWAEEATLYFKSIYENDWLSALLFIPSYTAEYMALAVNIPLTLAAHVFPLEYATFVSTYFSVLILLIPFTIVLWGNSYLWDSPLKKFLACLIILLAPTSTDAEIWLNTINLQVHCGIIAVCILFENLDVLSSTLKRWYYRILLLFSGLSGPYTMFLALPFLLKAWHEKSKESVWHFSLIFVTSSIQATLFLYIHYLGLVSPTKISQFDWIRAPIYIFNYHIMTPLMGIWVRLGANIEDFMITGKLQGTSLLIVSLATVITIVIILYFLIKKRTSFYRIILLVAFLCVSLLVSYASMGSIPYGRYAVIPGILFLLLILDNINIGKNESPLTPFRKKERLDTEIQRDGGFSQKEELPPLKKGRLGGFISFNSLNSQSLFLLTLLGISFVMGFISFKDRTYWMTYVEDAPKWTEEIAQWQQNSDHLIKSWPYPWRDPSWQFYLSDRELLREFKEKIHAISQIELTSQGEWTERVIPVNGLPIDFHLIFIAQVMEESLQYDANIVFLGEHEEFYGQYSIKNGLNQQTHAIIDFYSVDRRTQPHTKMIAQYEAVKKVVFRLKSNTSTTLKITNLKVIAQPMSVPLF
jgi:hypothetical protein